MEVSVSEASDISRRVDIVVPKEKVDAVMDGFLEDVKDRVQVKGYRKGHAPKEVIRSQLGDAVRAEVSARVIHEATINALNEKNIKVAGNPVLCEEYQANDKRKFVGEFQLDGSFKFAVDLELSPEIEIRDYKEISINKVHPFTIEGWVDKQIETAQKQYGDKKLVNRSSQTGDELLVDFVGTIDGEEFKGGKSEGHIFILGEGGFLPEFDKAFEGKKAGDEFEAEVPFPEDYHAEELKGKTAKFKCNVISVTELDPHPVDDTLAQMMSFADLDHMKQMLREKAQDYVDPARASMLTQIMDVLIEKHQFRLPKAWLEHEIQMVAQRMGLKAMPTDEQELQFLVDTAERPVRQSYILDKIYEQEKDIHLTAEEIMKLLEEEGEKIGQDADTYLSTLKRSGKYEGFMAFHEQQKTIDFLLAHATERGEE